MELVIPSCIHGYHAYGEVWTAVLGEQLLHECELNNIADPDFHKPQVSGVYESMVD